MDIKKEREAFLNVYVNYKGDSRKIQFNEETEQFMWRKNNVSDTEVEYVHLMNQRWYAWLACAKSKAQAVPKWISVKDKLPSDDIGRVLAWVVEQNSLGKCGFVWNCSHSNGVFSDKFETFQVTHWMPLPDAPQEPTND